MPEIVMVNEQYNTVGIHPEIEKFVTYDKPGSGSNTHRKEKPEPCWQYHANNISLMTLSNDVGKKDRIDLFMVSAVLVDGFLRDDIVSDEVYAWLMKKNPLKAPFWSPTGIPFVDNPVGQRLKDKYMNPYQGRERMTPDVCFLKTVFDTGTVEYEHGGS